MADVGILGCPYYAIDNGKVEWCDQDPVTPHHGEKVIEHSVAETSTSARTLTPLGCLIAPLNAYLTDRGQRPIDAAENVMDALKRGGWDVTCDECGRSWTDFCKCEDRHG